MKYAILGFMLTALLAILIVAFMPKNITHWNSAKPQGVMLGMWQEGFYTTANGLSVGALLHDETKYNKKFGIAHYYRGWDTLNTTTFTDELTTITANGWTPMISTNPYFFAPTFPVGSKNLYAAIAAGEADSFLTSMFSRFATYNKVFYFRFAYEMNHTHAWSTPVTGDTGADFAAAWRHMHDIAVAQGATNVKWVWNPNIGGNVAYNTLYPGNAYVDWVGLNGYNYGSNQATPNWQSFEQIFRTDYNTLVKLAPGKPVMIGETNSVNVGGDKAQWYRDTLGRDIFNFPEIKAVVFFNENVVSEDVDWTIDITPEAAKAFKEGIANPRYIY